jgi:hypothetical protein
MARSSGGPATTTWRKPPDRKQRETIKFCQPVERCPSRTVDKVSSAASLLQLQHIAGRALNRLNRLVLLVLWWEGRRADPGEKRGPRKTERHGRKTHSKCLTSTRRIENVAEFLGRRVRRTLERNIASPRGSRPRRRRSLLQGAREQGGQGSRPEQDIAAFRQCRTWDTPFL